MNKTTNSNLVGQFFHSIKDGRVEWQGAVLSNPEPNWYLVQLCEWGFGEPNVRRLVHISEMANWLFYESSEQMIHSYDHGVAREGGPYRPHTSRSEDAGEHIRSF
jgi:hypothetical protein